MAGSVANVCVGLDPAPVNAGRSRGIWKGKAGGTAVEKIESGRKKLDKR